MANIFGLSKLHDYLTALSMMSRYHADTLCSQGVIQLPSKKAWLLGESFENKLEDTNVCLDENVFRELLEKFESLMWITYRVDFPPLGADKLTTDVSWGCAIRSGQMMLAQALFDHVKPRQTRNGHAGMESILAIVSLFWDSPADAHSLSVHHFCDIASALGVQDGSWMGPGFVSKILAELVNKHHPFNLQATLISQSFGAPYITPQRICELEAVFGDRSDEEHQENGEESPNDDRHQTEVTPALSNRPGLLILIPLLLGTSKMHDRYMVQVKQTFTWPQSLGIIGGRSSSSLYIVGYQDDKFFYLDPHKAQPTTATASELSTYFNSPLRQMHKDSLITSLSVGFYCKNLTELQDLVSKLRRLEEEANGTPIISFSEKDILSKAVPSGTWSVPELEMDEMSDWEIINP